MVFAVKIFVIPTIILCAFYFRFRMSREATTGISCPIWMQKLVFPLGEPKRHCSAISLFGAVGCILETLLHYACLSFGAIKGIDLAESFLYLRVLFGLALFLAIGGIIDLLCEWKYARNEKSGSWKRVFNKGFNIVCTLTVCGIIIFCVYALYHLWLNGLFRFVL